MSASAPVLSVGPVVLAAPDRAVDLEIRVSAPVAGDSLPILLLSHGQGPSNHLSSMHGYAPLVQRWAAHGFVVIQPTHLSSRTLDVPEPPGEALHWRSRVRDMSRILDRLDEVEAAVPQLAGRLDRAKVAVAGHSMGGHTASMLLGARIAHPGDGAVVRMADSRIKAGVLLAAPGAGGRDALTDFVAEHYPFFLGADFTEMRTPALVVAGDADSSAHLTVRGPSWHAEPHVLSPARTSLLTLFGAEHGLGGISGYDVAETTDENPRRVAAVADLTASYLRSELIPGDQSWTRARARLAADPEPLGQIDSD
ncbi:alpha/beta hydrolase family protein [Saccharopolyspora sp. MS10]|uniref:alpha/beta hydrolase family protein n=1 Tax=Saccharopolyspora sp. MS10 TaxID=3385973 RepID=UPI00399FB8D5